MVLGYDPRTGLYNGVPVERLLADPHWGTRTFWTTRLAWEPPTPLLKLPEPESGMQHAVVFLSLLEARRLARAPPWHALTVFGAIGTAVVWLLQCLVSR